MHGDCCATKQKRKGFSVAEATIALLIGSIALGMTAPMITKQIKQNNMNDTQFRIMNNNTQDLREEIAELRNRIEELENTDNSGIPKGTIAFFDNTVEAESGSNPCPTGWEQVGTNWNGRFPRFAGTYTISGWNGTTYKGTSAQKTLGITSIEEDAVRNVIDEFWITLRDDQSAKNMNSCYKSGNGKCLPADTNGVFRHTFGWSWSFGGGGGGASNYKVTMDLSKSIPIAEEVRPKSVALLGCRKL